MTSRIDEILGLYRAMGAQAYRGERVSQLEHALQCGLAAEQAGATAALVVASLLHDYGHYLHDMDARELAAGRHDRHDAIGAAALTAIFPPAVTEPIALHVEAKRYLCAVEPSYLESLSPGSRYSLMVQGGPMDAASAQAFAARPYALDAAQVRRWDDAAKTIGIETPDLEHFRSYLAACAIG